MGKKKVGDVEGTNEGKRARPVRPRVGREGGGVSLTVGGVTVVLDPERARQLAEAIMEAAGDGAAEGMCLAAAWWIGWT